MEGSRISWKVVEGGRISWNFMEGTCPRYAWNYLSFFFSITLIVLCESISLLTQSNPIKKAPMKTCSWKLFRGNFYYRPISLRKSAIGSFLPPIVCGLRSFAFGVSPSRSRPPSIFRSLSCGAS